MKKDDWNKAASVSDGTANPGSLHALLQPESDDRKRWKDIWLRTLKLFKKGSVEVWVGTDGEGNNHKWEVVESLDNAGANDQKVTIDYRDGSNPLRRRNTW